MLALGVDAQHGRGRDRGDAGDGRAFADRALEGEELGQRLRVGAPRDPPVAQQGVELGREDDAVRVPPHMQGHAREPVCDEQEGMARPVVDRRCELAIGTREALERAGAMQREDEGGRIARTWHHCIGVEDLAAGQDARVAVVRARDAAAGGMKGHPDRGSRARASLRGQAARNARCHRRKVDGRVALAPPATEQPDHANSFGSAIVLFRGPMYTS